MPEKESSSLKLLDGIVLVAVGVVVGVIFFGVVHALVSIVWFVVKVVVLVAIVALVASFLLRRRR